MSIATTDYTVALPDGPWRHEFVPANGSRFHVALAGPHQRTPGVAGPPLVVLLHSFPQYWWAWRAQMTGLAEAGYRVAALDLRGTGASDKPPIGYDVPTLTRDVAGVIRSLGVDRAIVVGHGTGGILAWAMAELQPAVTVAVAALSAPHPARMHAPGTRLYTWRGRRLQAYYQLPFVPERSLQSGKLVEEVLAGGAARPWDPAVVETYRSVMRIPFAARSQMEAVRWAARVAAVPRPDGRRYLTAMRRPVGIPALQVQGRHDGFVHSELADLDAAALMRDFRFERIDAGYFLPEEASDDVTSLLLDWLGKIG